MFNLIFRFYFFRTEAKIATQFSPQKKFTLLGYNPYPGIISKQVFHPNWSGVFKTNPLPRDIHPFFPGKNGDIFSPAIGVRENHFFHYLNSHFLTPSARNFPRPF